MDLNGMALFVETMKHGSITGAAKALGKPKSTLSRQLSDFEEALGVRLVERTTRSLNLTEAGAALLEQSQSLIEELSDIQTSIGAYQRHPKGNLTLRWPQELFTEEMGELISEFLQRWPQISICGTQTVGAMPALESGYDLQFVLHQQGFPASDWIARTLMSIPNALYIASHRKKHAPKTLAQLSESACILQTNEHEWLFRDGQQMHTVPVSGRLTLNSPDMRLRAALRGLGIVRLPGYLADPWVKQGALTCVEFDENPAADQLSVIYKSRQLPLKTRLFLEHFQNHIGRLYSRI